MTYSLITSDRHGTTRRRLATAEDAVENIDRLRGRGIQVTVTIESEAGCPEDLTGSERRIIVKEGLRAAMVHRDRGCCPYGCDDKRRSLWLAGYDSIER
ncbi:hypothetical protein NCHU2750_44890 (plasmid) [Neorhizobium sp. NCHU2750]|nr:hypothetical protein NCHU2750_44890 [Neorhizobium sp. NCHU2750]